METVSMKEKMMNLDAIDVIIKLSGSIMNPTNVLKQYQQLTGPKRKYLCDMVKPIIKKYEKPFDDALPLLVVDLSICSSENNIDPAVALMAYMKKGK